MSNITENNIPNCVETITDENGITTTNVITVEKAIIAKQQIMERMRTSQPEEDMFYNLVLGKTPRAFSCDRKFNGKIYHYEYS